MCPPVGHPGEEEARIIRDIKTELNACYGDGGILAFKSFQDFFDAEDVRNTYERDWRPNYYRPYYRKIWDEIINGAEAPQKIHPADDFLKGITFQEIIDTVHCNEPVKADLAIRKVISELIMIRMNDCNESLDQSVKFIRRHL